MIAAFAYLMLTSMRNRLVSKAKRIRNPRYALALLFGLGYFYMFFFRAMGRTPRDQVPNLFGGIGASTFLPLVLLVLTAYAWISGGDKYALAFSEAEVAMLFPAPVSRRGLIVYKLVRAQAAVLFTSVIWSVMFRSGRGGMIGIIGYWLMLSIISLHRLGVALTFASTTEHGVRGLRRTWPAITIFGIAAAVLAYGILGVRTALESADGLHAIVEVVATASRTGATGWVLYPFRIAVGPMTTANPQDWFATLPPALVLVALHVWWVLRTESAFEETAAAASVAQAQRLQAMRSRGVSGATFVKAKNRRTLRLSPTGTPAVALLWKNYLWLSRTGQIRTLIGLPLIACISAVGFAGRSGNAEVVVAIMSVIMIVTVLLFGPMTMRNDLRGELRRLPMLKTLPLPGRQIILAEVTSSASPTAAVQYVLLVAAVLAISFSQHKTPTAEIRAGVLLGAPLLFLGLNLANFTIYNAMALLFPAWVRLGEASGPGVEMIGQMMLTMLATILVLAVLLIGPAIVGAAVYFSMIMWPLVAIAGAGTLGGAALCGEAYLLMHMLGGSLERLEPMQVG